MCKHLTSLIHAMRPQGTAPRLTTEARVNKRIRQAGVGLLALTAIVACSDGQNPAGLGFEPLATSSVLWFGGMDQAQGQESAYALLEWKTQVVSDKSVTEFCHANETCTITLRKPGVTVTVPAPALSQDTYISVTALAGKGVNLQFGPHGTQFETPISVNVSVKDTKTDNQESFTALYWVHDEFGNPVVQDQLPAWVDGRDLTFETDHFSGYAMAL